MKECALFMARAGKLINGVKKLPFDNHFFEFSTNFTFQCQTTHFRPKTIFQTTILRSNLKVTNIFSGRGGNLGGFEAHSDEFLGLNIFSFKWLPFPLLRIPLWDFFQKVKMNHQSSLIPHCVKKWFYKKKWRAICNTFLNSRGPMCHFHVILSFSAVKKYIKH